MTKLENLIDAMRSLSPEDSAADWDNVGLLVGSPQEDLRGILTCLTLTEDVAEEAIADGFNTIITHHPLMLKGTRSLTDGTYEGRTIRLLIKHGVNVYCPHTAFDNCTGGINDQIAAILKLTQVKSLRSRFVRGSNITEGRIGDLPSPQTTEHLAKVLKSALKVKHLESVQSSTRPIERVAIVCGAGGEFLNDAKRQGAQLFVTGEMRFHDCIAARENGMDVLLPGHYGTERIGAEFLATYLAGRFPEIPCRPSTRERNPLSAL